MSSTARSINWSCNWYEEAIDMTPMHLYTCEHCIMTFAVESHDDIDQSDIVCPSCKNDSGIEDAGYGHFELTIPAEETA